MTGLDRIRLTACFFFKPAKGATSVFFLHLKALVIVKGQVCRTQQFTTNAPTKAAAYAHVTYYAEHCGMVNVKLITEGYNNEENQKPTKKSTAGKKAPRKKSRKKR